MPVPITCLGANTPNTMADYSQKPFSNVLKGEMILSYNFETKKNEAVRLLVKNAPIHKNAVKFFFEDREIIGTPDHPFYSPEFGWVSVNPYRTELYYKSISQARELRLNMGLKLDIGKEVKLKGLLLFTETQQMYNISSLEKNYTYYANGILTSIE